MICIVPKRRIMVTKIIKKIARSGISLFILASVPLCAQQEVQAEDAALAPQQQNASVMGDSALTERQAIEYALKHSRSLQALTNNVDVANYRLQSSGSIRNPELRISDVSTHYYTEEFDELRAGVRWRLPKLGEPGKEKQQARVELWDRKVRENRFRLELIARTRKDFAGVLMYDQLAELLQQQVIKENKRSRIVEQLVALGTRSVVNFARAKIKHAESQNECARVLQNRRMARQLLAERTGIAENMALLAEDLPEVSAELDSLIQLAFSNRPEIELVQQRIELANRQKNFEYLKIIPWFSFIEISYHLEKERYKDWGELTAGINLPIFNWNRGNTKAAGLAAKNTQAESDAIRESPLETRYVQPTFIIKIYCWILRTFDPLQQD
ncbi:TolC family protein [candidate division KSB1 bacterium]|nr:TolC family protein [candidate division KSB1 bacterium]